MVDKDSLPSKSPLGFSPAASIDRFLALRRSTQRVAIPPLAPETRNLESTFVSKANVKTSTKKRKTGPTTLLIHAAVTDRQPQIQLQKDKRDSNGSRRGSRVPAQSSSQLGLAVSTPIATAQPYLPLQSQPRVLSDPRETNHPRPPRPPDPLPPPTAEEHRYIISTRLLQNSALLRALQDQELCHIQFIERDVEYLRSLLPMQTRNRDKTRVDVDIIVDEKNGILFYPLREIGQRDVQDPNAGLNELLACIGRIGPRYKVLWIIFEEYSWWSSLHPIHNAASSTYLFSGQTSTANLSHPIPRIDPYSGPVMVQLRKFMSWIPTTTEALSWTSKISYQCGNEMPNVKDDIALDDWGCQMPVHFQTRILFASDERCAARMSRAIGECSVQEIDRSARRGIRREEDGWRDKDEWLWRDWMNEQDSTHERFLACFQVFNLFSIQLILSLCSLKELMSMNHSKRVRAVGKFVDPAVLAKFDSIVTTPLV